MIKCTSDTTWEAPNGCRQQHQLGRPFNGPENDPWWPGAHFFMDKLQEPTSSNNSSAKLRSCLPAPDQDKCGGRCYFSHLSALCSFLSEILFGVESLQAVPWASCGVMYIHRWWKRELRRRTWYYLYHVIHHTSHCSLVKLFLIFFYLCLSVHHMIKFYKQKRNPDAQVLFQDQVLNVSTCVVLGYMLKLLGSHKTSSRHLHLQLLDVSFRVVH